MPAGRSPRFSLEAIVATADRILRTSGADELSMRRLAAELGSAPMTLYHHVRDRDELLLLVVDSRAGRMPRPKLPDDPRDRLIAAALLLHAVFAEHPWAVEVLTDDDLVVPSTLWIVETMIDAAMECGHTPEDAAYVYRTIWCHIVGTVMVHAGRGRRRPDRAGARTGRGRAVARLSADTHPRLAALADRWAGLATRDTHRRGLTAMIDGLLADRSSPGR